MSISLKKSNSLFQKLKIEDYTVYKEEFENIIKIKDEEFSNLFEIFKAYNPKKIFLSFLLFIHYKKWIFPSITFNNIICYNNSSFYSKLIFMLKKDSLDEKTFILWYFYLFYILFYENNNIMTNQIRYLLLDTNKCVSILYSNKTFKINNAINILDFYLMSLKQFSNNEVYIKLSSKMQKIKKKIFLKRFFDLLQKLSIISIKSNDYKDFEFILNYLNKIINNSELNDDINILLLLTDNIIQDFINNLFQNLDIVNVEQNLPKYKKELINFYTHFLINKYKTSNLFSNIIDATRKSYEHLYNFKYNKNLIIKDIALNSFNSEILNELLKSEKEKIIGQDKRYPSTSFFLFENKKSIISFEHNNILLDKVILFFSFQIGKYGVKDIKEFPLILIKSKNKNKDEIFLKIYLQKIDGNDEKESIKYKIYITQPSYKAINVIDNKPEYFIIDNNNTYYFAIYIHDKKIRTYLNYERYKKNNDNILYNEYNFFPFKKANGFKFIIGNDENNSFYKGKIGPIIMIEAPNSDDIINKVMDSLIQNIISLKDKYKDFIIIKSDLSKNYDFDLIDYYEQKEIYFFKEELSEKRKENKIEINKPFVCLLYLDPNNIKLLGNKIINDKNEKSNIFFPIISDFCKKNSEYKLLEMNVSIINYETIKKLFVMDNGLNFICLQIEYCNQFAQYYLLKNNKCGIFNKTELDIIINEIIKNLKANILSLLYHKESKYLYDSYKKVFVSLYNCLINVNKIMPIINGLFDELVILMEMYRSILTLSKNEIIEKDSDKLDNNQNNSKINIENVNNNSNHFLDVNITYYIGLIEILLDINFYDNPQKEKNITLIKYLFRHLINSQIKNETNMNLEYFININLYPNIYYKLLNFISLFNKYFIKNDNILVDIEKKNEYENLLSLNFKLLINIINNNNEGNNYFHEIFRFIFKNNRSNPYIIYSYLSEIYEFSKKNNLYFFNENEINLLEKFLNDLNSINEKEEKEKIKNLIILILLELIFSKTNKDIVNKLFFIKNYLNKSEISNELFTNLKISLEKYLLKFIQNNVNKSNIKNLNYQEEMKYAWDLFDFLIFILKYLKSNKSKYNERDFKMNLFSILGIFSFIEKENGEINLNNLNHFFVIYLIDFLKFLYYILNDVELIFLFNDNLFLHLIDNCFNNCFQSTLFHCNIYININEKDKESKKLISQIFLDLYMTHLDQIYKKYSNEDNKEDFSVNDLNFIKILSNDLEKKYMQEINCLDYNLKKNSSYDTMISIFYLSDFLKYVSDKKLLKKYEKNEKLSTIIKLYQKMKEIILDIDKNNKENKDKIDNNIFDFYFTSYYLYEIYKWDKTLDFYLGNKEILKHGKLVNILKELQSILFKFNIFILHDHFKLNLIYKDFYFKKIQNNDPNLKNLLKSIQSSVFNKKNKGKDVVDIFNESIKNEFLNLYEEKEKEKEKERKSVDINSEMLENISKDVDKTLKKKNTTNINEEKIANIINKEKEDKNEEINNIIKNFTIINNNDNEIKNLENENENENNSIEELESLELKNCYKNIFDGIDKNYIINPKKELMRTIFGVYFEKTFYNNNTFEKMKNYYLSQYSSLQSNTKLLHFPSKLKNFSNGLEPPYFLKENKKFFITKIFPITHEYFYNYMLKNNVLNESIILLKKDFQVSTSNEEQKSEKNDFDCELVKIDKIYFGHMTNSIEGEFIYFRQKEFNIEETDNLKEELEKKVFSLSALSLVSTKGEKLAKDSAKNSLLDEDIFPNEELNYNKTVIIFYSDIEEIIERRFLFLWQGIEIFLKNGKSYIFNMLTYENYNNLIKNLKNIKNVLFREKEFFPKTPIITENWRKEKLNTYEYLLYINKYSSRSLNDASQYYVFPWIVINFKNLIDINNKEEEISKNFLEKQKEKEKQETLDNNTTDIDNNDEFNRLSTVSFIENKSDPLHIDNFRNLKFPVSAQTEKNKTNKFAKYSDEDDKFRHHHGTHYSTSSYIYYYLMRLEPFTTLLVELQNYCQENPDRMMQDLKDTIKIIKSGNDNRELIPEFYSKIDYFININCAFYGYKKTKQIVDDVNIMWDNIENIYNSLTVYSKFIIEHKKLLNGKIISININSWIDNVFGVGQLPPKKKREKSLNIFNKTCYEEIQDLHHKLDKIFAKEKDNTKKIKKKIANRINLIISFGQTPHKIFVDYHKGRIIENNENNLGAENPENYGHKKEEELDDLQEDDYLGDDFIANFRINQLKREDNKNNIKIKGIFFETMPCIGKLFILNESCELLIMNTNFYSHIDPNNYEWKEIGIYNLPYFCFFDKFNFNNLNYYIFSVKYAFSSFPIDTNTQIPYLYSNQYITSTNEKNEVESFKFITCRHLDNSFKLHFSINIKKKIQLETFSYICEDFVMSCRTISYNSFIIGLQNGKLIKCLIYEYKPKLSSKQKKKEDIQNDKYKIVFEKYIQGHLGAINMIEIDQKLGVVLTSGDDNKLYIRKLYDFELLTSIKFKKKYIVTMAKISPMNFLYVICYNKEKKEKPFLIFGYTLSGLKFAKSSYSYYTNIDFTENGNIICLINENELGILWGHNLSQIKIKKDENDPNYKKYISVIQSIKNGNWMQFDDFQKYYGSERKVISYLSIEPNVKDPNLKDPNPKEQNQKEKYFFKTLKASNISYFQ